MKSKFVFTVLMIITLLSNSSFTQTTTSTIKGKVVEKSSNKPMESASVQVFSSIDSSLVTGMLSDANGVFSIENIADGTYTVKVSFIGYGTAIAKNVHAGKDNRNINFGNIKLDVVSESTQEIEVVDEAPIMTFEAGKKVYDAKKDLTTQSGNAMDVLKNVPSVEVDNDGNVSLRGSSNVKILIDGKPSALLSNGTQVLQNMPANVIDKIEVINNPSAKYEAEGVSGIINIIMKQQDQSQLGYNGNIKVNGGTEDKYNLSTGGSFKKGKLSVNGNYSYWNYSLPGITDFDRYNYSSVNSFYVNQLLNWKYKGLSHYGSLGMDYDLDKENTLSLVTNVFYYERNLNSTSNLDFYNSSNEITSNFFSRNENPRSGLNLDGTLTYSKRFKEKGRDFTTFINYSSRNENDETKYKSVVSNTTSEQNKKSNYRFNFANFQSDYVHPFGEKSKLETGVKSNSRFINGVYSFRYLDNTNQWLPVSGKDNNVNYKDVISAAYGEYSGEYKNFSYKGGLRGEYSYIKFDIQNETQKYDNNYFDLFPSISLSQKLGIENQFQASYSRRINRPNLFFLNPFVDQIDAYTVRSGNPYLEPEYTNSYELGYTRSLKFATLTLSGFYRDTKNPVNFVTSVDTNGVSTMKPENVGQSKTYGMELIAQGGLAKWWTLNGNLSYFNTHIFENNSLFNFDKTFNAWSARFSTNAAIPNLFDVQLSYFYFGKQLSAQGTIEPMQMMNIAIQKSLFEKKIVLGFRVNDILNQQRFSAINTGENFSQMIYQKSNSRAAFFTLTYNFGENSATKSQRTSQRKQRESENEIQQTGN